jgi:protein SCO1/2
MKIKNSTLGVVALLVIVFGISFFYVLRSSPYRGMTVNPPVDAAPIALIDSNGNPFQLADQRGKIVLAFFGYTHCPDECPAAMAKLKQALLQLGNQADQVQVILITTDPARDTGAQLKDYLSIFNPAFLGLTGTETDLQTVWDAYGVVVEDGGETHSELIYVIDQTGKLRLTFSNDLTPEDIAHDLSSLLAER